MTIYDIKPQFQSLLRPIVKRLAIRGISANQVTIFALLGSVLTGVLVFVLAEYSVVFLLLPIWLFIRMALNAIDGMLAREFNQKTHLGHILNELGDVIADIAFLLPFMLISPFTGPIMLAIVMLAVLTELTGILAMTIGASRRYDGPMGKSDRAFVFSIIALWIGFGGPMPAVFFWIMPVIAVLLLLTLFNRIKNALIEVEAQ